MIHFQKKKEEAWDVDAMEVKDYKGLLKELKASILEVLPKVADEFGYLSMTTSVTAASTGDTDGPAAVDGDGEDEADLLDGAVRLVRRVADA